MSSNRIEELKKQRQRKYKRKKNQIIYGIIAVIVVSAVFVLFLINNFEYSILWLIGLLLGFTLQRSRFCFAASFRDPVMVGSTSLFKAIIIAFIVSTIGFSIIQFEAFSSGLSIDQIPGQIQPVGLHTVIGAILFGAGMVVAGGCASGTLMRVGEGFILQIFVLGGFIIGVLLGANHFEFWDRLIISKTKAIYFPEYIGMPLAVIIQIIVLIALYFIADWYDKKNNMMSM